MKKLIKHEDLIRQWQKNPKFNLAYDELAEEFALFDAMLAARKQAGLTQNQVAKKMHTKIPAVARLESSHGKNYHSPTLRTLYKYAAAIGCKLVIKFVPNQISEHP